MRCGGWMAPAVGIGLHGSPQRDSALTFGGVCGCPAYAGVCCRGCPGQGRWTRRRHWPCVGVFACVVRVDMCGCAGHCAGGACALQSLQDCACRRGLGLAVGLGWCAVPRCGRMLVLKLGLGRRSPFMPCPDVCGEPGRSARGGVGGERTGMPHNS